MSAEVRIDALLPAEMAKRAEYIGVRKAEAPALTLFALAILAGAFISMGAIFATTVFSGGMTISAAADGAAAFKTGMPYGITRLLGGLVFCLGLIMVVVGGAELFTGNNLIVMAWANGKVSTAAMLRNWVIVYAGNFVGSIGSAVLLYLSGQYTQGSGAVGLTALNIANAKSGLEFIPALALGILCNALVCMAVWMTFSARSTLDKIAAIIFPITGFVAAGFEHSIANMYFIPVGLFIKAGAPEAFWKTIGKVPADFANLTWGNFFVKNLLPVTIGNIIGGVVLVAAIYWLVYLYPEKKKNEPAPQPKEQKKLELQKGETK
jgi:formate transporter